jgi:hypothetical protein
MAILVLTRTTGYRHESIEAGVDALTELAGEHGVPLVATEDPDRLLPGGYAAVAFLNTSGDILLPVHRNALLVHLHGGGGFVGVHCAAATEPGWPEYERLLGARFRRHPEVQPAVLRVTDPDHPATRHLPDPWSRVDEWYDFEALPSGVRVLLTVDESTYTGGGMGPSHPLAWCHEYGGGRVFYTALGHTVEAYAGPDLRAHLWGGLTWACRGTLLSPGAV